MKYKKIILYINLAESFGRNLIRGINRYSDIYGPWSYCKMPTSFNKIHHILDFAKEWGAQGIIGQFQEPKDVEQLVEAGLNTIAVDLQEKFNNVSNISGNYIQSGRMAADYFVAKGFKNFAFYGAHNAVWSRERENGFREQLCAKGYDIFAYSPKIKSHNFWYYKPSPLQKWLTSLPKPVAIFACDDNRAEHLLEAAKIANFHVPEDIAILGVDNDEMICDYANPPLSSIQQDEENGGYKAAQLMDQMITERRHIKKDILLEPLRIISRRSTDTFAMEDHYVKEALIFIRENLANSIHVSDLLSVVGLSRRALEKRFLRVMGRSVYKEIQRQRMEKVLNLLVDSNLSISEISYLCGYPDSKNLSRNFKSFYRISPLQYRKKYQLM